MTHDLQSAAKKTLLARRAMLTRARADNTSDAIALGSEKRQEELAQNGEISAVLVLLSERETAEVEQLDVALKKLAAGTWGTCERCHQPIAVGRMAAMPEARTCIECEP